METPPLTRGRPDASQRRRESTRNTPAYAGKTRPVGAGQVLERKHPRLRGEDSLETPSRLIVRETPPLTRGRLHTPTCESERNRNTPAYAGKTVTIAPDGVDAQKHPRLRGEDVQQAAESVSGEETPPLTRGRQFISDNPPVKRGNTPAYAGKTLERFAHTRSEKETPPLTRGRPCEGDGFVLSDGNTPAYAGKTEAGDKPESKMEETPPLTRGRRVGRRPSCQAERKHPRLRGEDGQLRTM